MYFVFKKMRITTVIWRESIMLKKKRKKEMGAGAFWELLKNLRHLKRILIYDGDKTLAIVKLFF